MKQIFVIGSLLLCHATFGQDENRFRNVHGIDDPDNRVQYFETEGYEIFIQEVDHALHERGIRKVRREYSVPEARVLTDPELGVTVLSDTDFRDGVTAHVNLYLLPGEEEPSIVVGFIRPGKRDVDLERMFMRAYMDNTIPPSVFTRVEVDSIDFVGRTIVPRTPCRWISPHNVECPGLGQIRWAIFDDPESARKHRDTFIEMARNKRLTDVIDEGWVPITFEGKETQALKTTVKIQLPKIIIKDSNTLVVYYVATEVRGKFVACVLSHHTDDTGSDALPAFLAEVMEL